MIVDEEHAGKTVSAIVRLLQPELPWSRAKKWCTAGRVRVDGRVVRDPAARVVAGARVEIGAPVTDTSADVPILAVDPHLVVIDKPAGLVSVPFTPRGEARTREAETAAEDTVRHRLHVQLRRRFGNVPPPRVVQRLDRETSGVMLFARTRRAEKALADQLRAHSVQREYVALAWGRVPRGKQDTWLVRDRGDRRRGSGRRNAPGAQRAITEVSPERYFATHDVTLVRCRLHTGRQHQIRIHLSELGHPLLGERVYLGPVDMDRRAWVEAHAETLAALGVERTLLHAERLGIRHPATDEPVLYTADPPPDFAAVLARLRAADG